MSQDILDEQREHLAQLLEAIQRCAWFLHQSEAKLEWAIDPNWLTEHKKDVDLFETLAAINERFAKLQDALASAMRHSALLAGESSDSFLKVLAFFEKQGVIDATSDWQRCRAVRNMAAHDYATNYAEIAAHFNLLHELSDVLFRASRQLIAWSADQLGISPASQDFSAEFERIFA
ncbi:hypothetical protein [Halomonas lysinitropha]|uniref:DUF86 domain-containing protein n=1 Tax=Halomonas lysinitropha TaxID=2607506 RepID=A0A5K1I351_9GAMM|nr:hypothetical protein [Halomonas lysinitropha]VVZ94557.1 hypothetical protein HALO32_00610 [Halomonas lysinitropha]